ncbi:MAG TPA: TIGR03620 family F420-dependent LLM class oxidoreductase [Gaiellaceae bacterium]
MTLGRIGIWSFLLARGPIDVARELARHAERLGLGALWYPETPVRRESLTAGAALLAATERIGVASGIASIWARDGVAAENGARALNEAWDARFTLGLGVSHAPSVASRGGDYRRPLSAMRAYLDAMDGVEGERAPRLLAALAPGMLELARDRADGAHTYFVPPEHTAVAREALGAERTLAVEQAVVLEADPERAREIARRHTVRYLSLPNYRNNLLRLGIEAADLDGGGSDALVDRIVAWGGEEAVAGRVRAHLAAGADHVCVQVLTADDRSPLAELERLAPTLLAL